VVQPILTVLSSILPANDRWAVGGSSDEESILVALSGMRIRWAEVKVEKVEAELADVISALVHLELAVHDWSTVLDVTSRFPRTCKVGAVLLCALPTRPCN